MSSEKIEHLVLLFPTKLKNSLIKRKVADFVHLSDLIPEGNIIGTNLGNDE